MKKVLLRYYDATNLGDDLFVKTASIVRAKLKITHHATSREY